MLLNRSRRIITMLVLTSLFFVVELLVGYFANSIALVADAMHMLSDVFSLIIALYAIKLSKNKDYRPQFTYGWQRAEILGALINGVFLVALCFSIVVQTIERFLVPADIDKPVLILCVGGAGLVVNLLGLLLFHEHGHGHGGHDAHSLPRLSDIAESAQSAIELSEQMDCSRSELLEAKMERGELIVEEDEVTASLSEPKIDTSVTAEKTQAHDHRSHEHEKSSGHVNMRGVFLHVLGDALGSVGVIVSGLVIWLGTFDGRFYVDPVISLVITGLILSSTIPLVRSTCSILLQGVPRNIHAETVRDKIRKIPNVLSIHEFHLWTLSEQVWVASVHVKVAPSNFMRVAVDIKVLMHEYGIHSTTVQPEFVYPGTSATSSTVSNSSSFAGRKEANERESMEESCLLKCADTCQTKSVCCPP